jgi:hypothetical protein
MNARQSIAPAPQPQRMEPAFSQPSSFDAAVQAYQTNYTEYKLTGNAAFKIAYENAQTWIETHLARLREQSEKNNQVVGTFVQQYEKTNPELVGLQKEMKSIRTEGPRLEDKYETEKRIYEQAPPDMTSVYVKGVIAAALLGIGAAVAVL